MMSREEKAAEIGRILDQLYPNPEPPLNHTSPYTLLIAVLMSAQTTDLRVNMVTPDLFAAASTPAEMVKLTPAEIQALIRSIGLAPTKSRNIYKLSQMLLDEHDGKVPETLAELEKLPGVGHKTASVVVSAAFGKPAFPVDTHIHRLAKRWGVSNGKNVKQTEQDLKQLFPPEEWNRRHLQIIFYGREHCPARQHDPAACMICSKYGVAE